MTLDRYQQARRVIDLLEIPLAQEGYELLDVHLFAGGGRLTVRVFLDDREGMTLDACAAASRTIGMLMEEADLFPDAYVIEVSSPGVRRPLRTLPHFQAAVTQDVVIKIRTADGTGTVKGRLVACTGQILTVVGKDDDATEHEIPLARVLEANLVPDFDPRDLIAADRRRRKDQKKQELANRRNERKGR